MPQPREPEWRKKVQAGVLANRLMQHAEGKIEMTNTQIKAADILLKKVVPDLARTEVTGKDGKDLTINWPLPKSDLDV